MRNYKKNNKSMYLLVILLVITLGYALLSATLKINGTISLKNNTWSIHWDPNSVNVSSGSVNASAPSFSNNNLKVSYEVNLASPGDFYEFSVDAVNNGTIDGMIDDVKVTVVNGDDEEMELPSYIVNTVTYDNGDTVLKKHLLESGDSATFLIKVLYDASSGDLPEEDLTIKLTTEIVYKQADSTKIPRNVVYPKDGTTFNNVMLNLAYNANKSAIGNYEFDGSGENIYNGSRYVDVIGKIAEYIEHVNRATDEQYNAVKNTLTSDELIDLSNNAEDKDMLKIATNTAVSHGSRANMNIKMWYDKNAKTIYYYSDSEKIVLPKDVSGMFWGLVWTTSLDASSFDTSKVVNMANMFRYNYNLPTLDLSSFNTSKVTDMSYMFYATYSMNTLDISSFNTSKVENMEAMFRTCACGDLDFSGFNTSKVTNMSWMFEGYGGITGNDPVATLGITGFDTSNVTTMFYMFSNANVAVLDLSSFDTKKVTNFGEMFGSDVLTTIYVSDKWSMESLENSYEMFTYCSLLTGGNGTVYDEIHTDHEYARIDADGSPGYFTRKTT